MIVTHRHHSLSQSYILPDTGNIDNSERKKEREKTKTVVCTVPTMFFLSAMTESVIGKRKKHFKEIKKRKGLRSHVAIPMLAAAIGLTTLARRMPRHG